MRTLLAVKDFFAERLYTLCESYILKVDANVHEAMGRIGPCPDCGRPLDEDGFGIHTDQCMYAYLGGELPWES
jgi:hypothetical protein